MKSIEELVMGIEDATIDIKDLSGYELFILAHSKLASMVRAEANRRLTSKGLTHTPYGWLSKQDIGELQISLIDGQWSSLRSDLLTTWLKKKKENKENERIDRQNATQSRMSLPVDTMVGK